MRFYTDMPAGQDPDPLVTWSHPDQQIWEVFCEDFREEFVGYDFDPRTGAVSESTFQYSALFRPEQYFDQMPGTIYWISVAAAFGQAPSYAWGWKTRPRFFQDDAAFSDMPGVWTPVEFPPGTSWDTAFELIVPEPASAALLLVGSAVAAMWRRRR